MESSFATLYQAFALQEKCPADGPALRAPLKDVYPYAVFFLNTLGGSSYLIRRDSRVRMLTQYYSILILDQANKQRLNKRQPYRIPGVRLQSERPCGYKELALNRIAANRFPPTGFGRSSPPEYRGPAGKEPLERCRRVSRT